MSDDDKIILLKAHPPSAITTTKGFTHGIQITETVDGAGRMKTAGPMDSVHRKMVVERTRSIREIEKTKRVKLVGAVAPLLLSSIVLAFGQRDVPMYIAVAMLLAVAGGFGLSYAKVKIKDASVEARSESPPP